MRLTIQSADELGLVLRAVRKDSGVPLEDLAQTVGVSRQTATNVEQGRAKVSTMIAFLREMGILVSVEIPHGAFANFERLQRQSAARACVRDCVPASETQANPEPADTKRLCASFVSTSTPSRSEV